MAFLTVKPPVNAQFAEAYNAIVEGCWKRGFGLDLKKKKIGGFDGQNRKEHEITSEDMQQLRDIIKEGKDQFFDRSKLKLEDGSRFSHGGEANREDHFTAEKHTIYISTTRCSDFTKCVKENWAEVNSKAYNTLTNNCKTGVLRIIRYCRKKTLGELR